MSQRTDLMNFCKELPKIELHAHINASIPSGTLEKLQKQAGTNELDAMMLSEEKKVSYEDHFNMYKVIHRLNNTLESTALVTKEVLQAYYDDGCAYLEIRSTPKNIPETGVTSRNYMETVIATMKDFALKNPGMIVKYLPSIDRREGVEKAENTVKLAIELSKGVGSGVIAGIDMSGDGNVNRASDYIPAFQMAQEGGLRCAIHLAETDAQAQETREVLQIEPRLCGRIGHGCYIHMGPQDIIDMVKAQRIPIEVCPTSNLKTNTYKSLEENHFGYWRNFNHPCIICADGIGVFDTTLSHEYYIIAVQWKLTKKEIWQLAYDAVDSIFADNEIKERLRKNLETFAMKNI